MNLFLICQTRVGLPDDAKALGKMIDKLPVEAYYMTIVLIQIRNQNMWYLKEDVFH